jgi:hypothetical protein
MIRPCTEPSLSLLYVTRAKSMFDVSEQVNVYFETEELTA